MFVNNQVYSTNNTGSTPVGNQPNPNVNNQNILMSTLMNNTGSTNNNNNSVNMSPPGINPMPIISNTVNPNPDQVVTPIPTATPGNNGNLTTTGNNGNFAHALEDPNVYHWICQLTYGPQKEQALLELGRKREQFDDLAVVLWSSFGVMTSLLSEIISVYPMLQPNLLSNQLSNRVCNALVLLQCVASHPETKHLFLQAHIPLFLFPFLNTTSRQRTFEYLRLTSLGVIGALVKNDSQDVISFLLRTDIVPLCLRIMESSSELSKTVAIFILQKILLADIGLQYICATLERFYAVTNVLKDMVEHLTAHTPPGRLLKHIIRCYLRLSDDLEARRLLKVVLPQKLRANTFTEVLKDDVGSKRCLAQLLLTLNEDVQPPQQQQQQQQQQPPQQMQIPLPQQQMTQ
ncbi:protein Caf40p [Monosporozyma unispora]|nr:CCR4-NOT core subunit caf40 [Kazachstania unispora]